MKLNWEPMGIRVKKARVYGGWLVAIHDHPVYIYDPTHEWSDLCDEPGTVKEVE